MHENKFEFWVGLFVLAGALSVVFIAFQVSGLTDWVSRPGYTVYAEFDNIGSLRSNSAVSASGVLVGRVVETGYSPQKFKAWAKLKLDSQFQFPIDSRASIHTSGLLGEQYIDLDPGLEEDFLVAGDYIYDTDSALVLEELVGRLVSSFIENE